MKGKTAEESSNITDDFEKNLALSRRLIANNHCRIGSQLPRLPETRKRSPPLASPDRSPLDN
jgi:hypothetical protein